MYIPHFTLGHHQVLPNHCDKGWRQSCPWLGGKKKTMFLPLVETPGNNSPLGEQNLLEGWGQNAISLQQAGRNCCWKAYLSREESDIRLCQASGPTHEVPPTSNPPPHPSFVRLLALIAGFFWPNSGCRRENQGDFSAWEVGMED